MKFTLLYIHNIEELLNILQYDLESSAGPGVPMNTNKHIYIIVIVCLYMCVHVSSVTMSLSACYSAVEIFDAFVHIRDSLDV